MTSGGRLARAGAAERAVAACLPSFVCHLIALGLCCAPCEAFNCELGKAGLLFEAATLMRQPVAADDLLERCGSLQLEAVATGWP